MSQPDIKSELQLIPLRDLTALLVKHLGMHEGLWDVAFEIQMGIGQFGPTPSDVLPGAMMRVARVGLAKAQQIGPLTVNAAEINPASQ